MVARQCGGVLGRRRRGHRCERYDGRRLVVVIIMILVVVFGCVVIQARTQNVMGLEVPEANVPVAARTYGTVEKINKLKLL